MFDSIAQTSEHDDERWQLLRKAFFIVPPAFCALCLAVFTVSLITDARALTEGIRLLWTIGMVVLPFVIAVLCATSGRWRWALGAVVYGYAVAAATLIASIYVIVGLGRSIH